MASKFFDRDLSWISFNYRVLQEAQKENVPLLERLRFIAIYSSNLDEFFRVRVAGLRSIKEIDKKKLSESVGLKQNLLKDIHAEVSKQLNEYGKTLEQVLQALDQKGIKIGMDPSELGKAHQHEIDQYFKTKVLAYLRSYVFGVSKHEPFLDNQQLYLALRLKKEKDYFGYVNIPSNNLPRFFMIKKEDGQFAFVYLDDIVRENIEKVFPGFEVLECKSIKLNKNADLNIDDEFSGDLVQKIEKQIKKRNLGQPSRFLYDGSISQELLAKFKTTFDLYPEDLVSGGRYHNLNDFFQIPNPTKEELEFPTQAPVKHKAIDEHSSVLKAMETGDHLLHFPYQSYDYTLQFFNEAAIDPEVKEIFVTFYRMASSSVIGEALISAANNEKKVVVFMELKARFDEENNLKWAERFKNAGVKIIYSIPGLKVHAKVALIRKKNRNYGFFGTGNLNEKTAKIYSDFALLSCDPRTTKELHQIFKFLHKKKKPNEFEHLVVSQFNAVPTFKALIEHEMELAKAGEKGEIVIKVNNLEDKEMIAKLYEAAESGVDVKVMARSICCLIPDSHDISVTRIVDRYLEHARIFYFGNGGHPKVISGSSDWMSRNLHRRIEVCFPIYDEALKSRMIDLLRLHLTDNTAAVNLNSEMMNVSKTIEGTNINAQNDSYELIKKWHGD